MNDKTKPTKPTGPDKSQAGVVSTLANCGLQGDPSSVRISAGIMADNLAGGAKGQAAIMAGTRGIPENIGKCAADAYDEKKPGLGDKISSAWGSLTNSFSSAATTFKDDAKLVAGQAVMSGVSAVTNDTPGVIRDHQARTQAAASGVSAGPGGR